MSSVVLETSRQEKLLRVMEEKGFTLSQQNGQRIYGGPPPNWGSRIPPSRESEIFIGRIPRLCFEDELIPLFSSIGELYEFRLMLDFSGTNRGFAYAQYADEESAFKAIKLLNHYEIRPGHYIGVLRCKNNCRLLFSNIKQELDFNIFSEQIKSLTKEILKISMFENFSHLKAAEIGVTLEMDEAFQERITRYAPESKFAIVEYETHKAAAVARRILIPKLGHMFGIDWAIPPKDSHQFDQGLSSRFDATLVAGNDFLKIRPVPVFNPPRSNLDAVLYMCGAYRNIAKYFRYLVNTTLYKSMRKGDIPLPVYLELEKKIIERVKSLEHCGQATQLLLNYLTWYREKMMMFIDPESEKILIEVKYYAEKMLEIANGRIAVPRGYRCHLEEECNNTLSLNLNYLYYMAIFLGGDDRSKVCGLITDSLDWFTRMMQRARDGNEEVNQFMVEISRLALEMEEEKKRCDPFTPPERIRKRKPELMPPPTQNAIGWNPFSGQSFPPLKKSALAASLQSLEIMETESLVSSTEQPTAASIYEIDSPPDNNVSTEEARENSLPCEEMVMISSVQSGPNAMGTNNPVIHANHSIAVPVYQDGNSQITANPPITNAFNKSEACLKQSPDSELISCSYSPEFAQKNPSNHFERNAPSDKRLFASDYKSFDLTLLIAVPEMRLRSCLWDFSMMPRQYENIYPYYKYIITTNLQKSVERCEVPLHTYGDIMTRIINRIVHLEGCIVAAELIVRYLSFIQQGMSSTPYDRLFAVLEDVRIYASAMFNYVRVRGLRGPIGWELEEYYLRLVPNQMSFLFHLTQLLDGDDKAKISGRLTDSIKWLEDLVQKSRAGDVEAAAFFEKITNIGERQGSHPGFREILKDVYDEFSTISKIMSRVRKN